MNRLSPGAVLHTYEDAVESEVALLPMSVPGLNS